MMATLATNKDSKNKHGLEQKNKIAHVFVLCQGPGLGFRVLWPGLRPSNGSDWTEWESTAPASDLERRYLCVCEY